MGRLTLVEVATGQERLHFQHGSQIVSVDFDPTGLRVVASSPEAPVYVWDLVGQLGRWNPAKADAVWADLASNDAKTGFAAIGLLRTNPAEAIAFLRERVQMPATPTKKIVVDLIEEIDSPLFAEREKAQKDLTNIAELCTTWIDEAMKGKLSEEVRERLKKVLKSLEMMTPERLRQIRHARCWKGSLRRTR